jgi:type IV secretion system protein VirD4
MACRQWARSNPRPYRDRQQHTLVWTGVGAKLLAALKHKVRDPNGGIRREPETPQHEDVVIKAPLAENEFDAVPDEGDTDALQSTASNRSMQGLARSVSLDPDDEMGF